VTEDPVKNILKRTIEVRMGVALDIGREHYTMTIGLTEEVNIGQDPTLVKAKLERNVITWLEQERRDVLERHKEGARTEQDQKPKDVSFYIDNLEWHSTTGPGGPFEVTHYPADTRAEELFKAIKNGMGNCQGYDVWVMRKQDGIGRRKTL
jgi:hypothetical protein